MNAAIICKHLHANPEPSIGQQGVANCDDDVGTGFTWPFLNLVIVTHALEELVTELAREFLSAEFPPNRFGQPFSEPGMNAIDASLAATVPNLAFLERLSRRQISGSVSFTTESRPGTPIR